MLQYITVNVTLVNSKCKSAVRLSTSTEIVSAEPQPQQPIDLPPGNEPSDIVKRLTRADIELAKLSVGGLAPWSESYVPVEEMINNVTSAGVRQCHTWLYIFH